MLAMSEKFDNSPADPNKNGHLLVVPKINCLLKCTSFCYFIGVVGRLLIEQAALSEHF